LRILGWRDSDAQVRAEQDAGGGQAPLLRVDQDGLSGSKAAKRVGVSLSWGSLWFIDAGRVSFIETPISPRYLSQYDRIEIADGLSRGEPVRQIAARIRKSYQSVYREIARNRKPDGRYQPLYAHNQAYQRSRRPKPRQLSVDTELCQVVAGKLAKHWSPAQISRWLRRRYRRRPGWHVCTETIYEAVYRGLVVPVNMKNLRTGRTYRHRRGRRRVRGGRSGRFDGPAASQFGDAAPDWRHSLQGDAGVAVPGQDLLIPSARRGAATGAGVWPERPRALAITIFVSYDPR
jgi:transposase